MASNRRDRLRAAGRVLVFFVLLFVALVITSSIEDVIEASAARAGYRVLFTEWSMPLSALVATLVCLRWVTGQPWSYVSLGRDAARPKLLIVGALVGAAAIGIPSLILLSAGDLRAIPAKDGSSFALAAWAFLNLLPAAAGEELVMRGYLFACMRDAIGWKWTLIWTSVVFGLLHLNNPGADAESVGIVMLAGFFLGVFLLATKSLYATIVMHFAWNWVMAAGLHTAVSGIDIATPDYRVVDSGPDWLTGGAWGPEGGFAAAVSMFVAILYIYGRYLSRMEQKNG